MWQHLNLCEKDINLFIVYSIFLRNKGKKKKKLYNVISKKGIKQIDEYEKSFSYSGEYSVCTLANNRNGVDIDSIRKVEKRKQGLIILFSNDNKVFFSVFSPVEIWTMHEAIGKYEKVGLKESIDLLDFEVKKIEKKGLKKIIYYEIQYVFHNEKCKVNVIIQKIRNYVITIAY